MAKIICLFNHKGGVSRTKDWLPHAATYSHFPSLETSTPLAPAASLPGTLRQPFPVCHSQSSPLFSPAIILVREALAFAPRSRKLVVTKPPPGSGTTEFSPIESGAIAHPIQVNTGILPRESTSNTSMDSLFPWWTAYSV